MNQLIDSGSTYTILSWEVLLSLELDPAASPTRRSIVTANGILVLPEVTVDEIHVFGQHVEQSPVLAYTVPFGHQVDGVLGMNILRRFDMELNFKQAIIQYEV